MDYSIRDKKKNQWIIYITGVLICLSLLARDVMGVELSKYVLLLIALLPIVFAKIEYLVSYICFLIPLYVGLPGNIVSVCLLVRLFYEAVNNTIKLDRIGFILTYLVVAYVFIQNIVTGYTSVFNLMSAFDFFTLFLVMSALNQYRKIKESIFAFALGNFALGIIMLSATLSFYSLTDLMNPATRLGYTGMLLGNSGSSMATSIDPNFYAMNVIATIASGSLIYPKLGTKLERAVLLISMFGCVVCCLIGLSRTFIILLLIWGILWSISQGNFKQTIVGLSMGIVLIVVFFQFMPTVATGLLARFSGADVAGGNGRINLILMYFEPWFENFGSILFGIGLFNCHTHCAPLMYLFGLGVIGAIPLMGWFIHYWIFCRKCIAKLSFKQWLPFFVTFISYSTIPAAGAINYTLPILISIAAVMIDE